jgi:hypothetical protein
VLVTNAQFCSESLPISSSTIVTQLTHTNELEIAAVQQKIDDLVAHPKMSHELNSAGYSDLDSLKSAVHSFTLEAIMVVDNCQVRV